MTEVRPVALAANTDKTVGALRVGAAFVLTADERDALVARDRRNDERIVPYVGGAELDTSPTQDTARYVIDFGEMSLAQARRWPDLLAIVRRRQKPTPARLDEDSAGRRRNPPWWQLGRHPRSVLEKLASSPRCLAAATRAKHLCFAFQPTNRVFADDVLVLILSDAASFAVLQSRAHALWTTLHVSMSDDVHYTAACCETFPFPPDRAMERGSSLDDIGSRLHRARADYMVANQVGLGLLYDRLNDAAVTDPAISALRALHTELDRVVLDAYGWDDLDVLRDDVVDRLVELNAVRARAERAADPGTPLARAENPLDVYDRARRTAGPDELHDQIARHGTAILQRGVPYVVQACRWRKLDAARRARRELPLDGRELADDGAFMSPFTAVLADQQRRLLVETLADLDDPDVLCVWRHVEGTGDDEIAREIADLYGLVLSPAAIRKRRERAIASLRARFLKDPD